MSLGESWCINGVKEILKLSFGGTSATEKTEFFFFSNDVTPSSGVVSGDLTEIGTSTGLGRKELVKSQWSAANTVVGTSTVVYVQYNGTIGLAFTLSSTATMYGYAIRGQTSGAVYYVKNVGSHSFSAGDVYTVSPIKMQMEMI